MQDTGKFRRFFNEKMHKELLEFELKRKKLLLLMFLGVLTLSILSAYVFSLDLFALSAFMLIPWFILFRGYRYWATLFADGFKPLVVSLLLQFMDSELTYYHKEFISKDTFLRAAIFPINPEIYSGEDYIMGKIGELFFELCELEIHQTSTVKGKLEKWFDGIFFHVNFNTSFSGRIVIIPRPEWQNFIPVMKDFTKYGGRELTDTGYPGFDKDFLVYIDRDINYKEMLSPELIEMIHDYHNNSGKKVYASFYDSHFYMAINEPQDLLDASLWHSNLNFELIASYYQELSMFTKMVADFDITH